MKSSALIFMGLNALSSMNATSFPSELVLSHVDDNARSIRVAIDDFAGQKRYRFSICDVGKSSQACQKIGRRDFYREDQLGRLKNSYLFNARLAFWSETIALLSAGAFTTYALVRYPDLRKVFRAGAPLADEAMMLESVAAAPDTFAHPKSALRSYSPPPSYFKPAISYLGQGFDLIVKPIALATAWNLRNEFSNFLETSTRLVATSLSPAEHYRASHLLDELLSASDNLSFSNRQPASFYEYYHYFSFRDLTELKTKLEDILASCN